MKRLAVVLILTAALGGPAFAQQPAGGHEAHHPSALTDGEVRRVNKETQRITVRHGPIANLDMPAHTMVFQVKDPALLEQVKSGDKIRFEAEKIPGGYAITRIEPRE